MRFTPLHFLFLTAALAAPVHDVQRASKRTEYDSILTRGLVPLDSRAPFPPVRVPPKVPKPPTRPPAGRPGHGDSPGPPPPLVPDTPTTPPTKPKDGPDGSAPKHESDPVNRPDDDLNTVGAPACGKRGKRALCVDDDLQKPLSDAEVQSFKDEGLRAQKGVDDAIAGTVPVRPKANANPKNADGSQNYKGYVAEVKDIENPKSTYEKEYLNDERWKDAFDPSKSKEFTFENSQEKKNLAKTWAENEFKPQLQKDNPIPEGEDWMQFMIDGKVGEASDKSAMLRTYNSAGGDGKGGSMVVKGTYKEKDLSQPGKLQYNDKTYDRPGFPEGRTPRDIQNDVDVLFPSDQMMASWRQTVAEKPGAKLTDLQWLAMDRMETPVTRKLVDDIMKKQNKQPGEMMTFEKGSPEFDQLAGTPHGAVVLRMLRDNNKDLGGKKIKAFHVLKQKEGEPPDMMIEFTMLPTTS